MCRHHDLGWSPEQPSRDGARGISCPARAARARVALTTKQVFAPFDRGALGELLLPHVCAVSAWCGDRSQSCCGHVCSHALVLLLESFHPVLENRAE